MVNLRLMCGFAAIAGFTEKGKSMLPRIAQCAILLKHRGPDNQQHIIQENFAMAHARLSIIDLSPQSNQPFTDNTGRFTVVYNGEIFNYKKLREDLLKKGHRFYTDGDVEVLVNLYREYGPECLGEIHGFFAFVIHDKQANSFFCARDRFGVKPFYYYKDENYFACASELRTLKSITGSNAISKTALFSYLQLSYIPESACILENISKLAPGEYFLIKGNKTSKNKYYSIQLPPVYKEVRDAGTTFVSLLENAIADRMVSDVPVGSFLSGGIDSSVITALASKQNKDLQTFSIGFKDNKHFDESVYAEAVAKKYKTRHHTFYFEESEAEQELDHFFDAIDEPFGDSSAFNVFVLAKKTKAHVKVVLSGDGADELFAGYNKHRAEWMVRRQHLKTLLLKTAASASRLFPSSRGNKIENKIRQLQRFADGANVSSQERYWRWASFYPEKKAKELLRLNKVEQDSFNTIKNFYTNVISEDYNSVLLADLNLVLPSDMLVKVDRMSMAHGLEVRNPFLDHHLVEFAFSLDTAYKIDGHVQKKIIKESCGNLLPGELLHREKRGFETPVQQWLRGVLRNKIDELCLDKNFIEQQGLFNYDELQKTVTRSLSNDSGDSTSVVWSLLIFNHWYKKNIL